MIFDSRSGAVRAGIAGICEKMHTGTKISPPARLDESISTSKTAETADQTHRVRSPAHKILRILSNHVFNGQQPDNNVIKLNRR